MRKNSVVGLAVVLLLAGASLAQVLSPAEIKDTDLRALQQQYMDDLKQVGQDILANQFEYPFYLSRKLDLDEAQQARADQRSIRFDRFNSQIVLAVTGNYYASYSADKMSKDQRARETLLKVVMPVLKAEVPRFQSNHQIRGYAVEISHHIMGKVMGVSMERPENLMVYLPQAAAIRLVAAKDDATQQAALLQGQVFLNAQPITIWLNGEGPQLAGNAPADDTSSASQTQASKAGVEIVHSGDGSGAEVAGTASAVPSFPKPKEPPPAPPRDTSSQALAGLQAANQELIGQIVKELDAQAHFVTYTTPSFVAFRQGIYLELSINTNLPESAGGSRYKLAAVAFDDHVAHLVRPALAYFKDEPKFDGIGFSTTVHVAGKSAAASTSQAVEFFFPFSALHCYEKYDCTGQQLIDAGTVLVNGERVGLDLQVAEAGGR
ncbi:MAG: hypothetical protein LAN83_14325 [Acidobacteriia bacterium]|nr:hypothetical protein [Terriglobia bacterium]